jgi:hypothetical protein
MLVEELESSVGLSRDPYNALPRVPPTPFFSPLAYPISPQSPPPIPCATALLPPTPAAARSSGSPATALSHHLPLLLQHRPKHSMVVGDVLPNNLYSLTMAITATVVNNRFLTAQWHPHHIVTLLTPTLRPSASLEILTTTRPHRWWQTTPSPPCCPTCGAPTLLAWSAAALTPPYPPEWAESCLLSWAEEGEVSRWPLHCYTRN